ncbi:proline--tRNA ligase [Synechocystis sp. B12]|nr:proline--tRNA ligase [Synechocystis sp. B12]
MRLSQMLFVTLRDDPADAEIPSHKLLVRAGFIRRLGSGLYAYLPLMWRVLEKVKRIVQEEMNRTGAQECLLPQLQPSELWKMSGRWDTYTESEGIMFALRDRLERELGLGPTHEEVITAIAKEMIRSYRQLPVNLYQIQTKFRDEIRPRFGLMRGREFIMKDAYSFHSDEASLKETYGAMDQAYRNIFSRCGLDFRPVDADSGAIGGSGSQEFMVLADAGEDEILYTADGLYSANVEKAVSVPPNPVPSIFTNYEKRETPNCNTIDSLTTYLQCSPTVVVKNILYKVTHDQGWTFFVLVSIRGDQDINDVKLKNEYIKQFLKKNPFQRILNQDLDNYPQIRDTGKNVIKVELVTKADQNQWFAEDKKLPEGYIGPDLSNEYLRPCPRLTKEKIEELTDLDSSLLNEILNADLHEVSRENYDVLSVGMNIEKKLSTFGTIKLPSQSGNHKIAQASSLVSAYKKLQKFQKQYPVSPLIRLADETIIGLENFVTGANEANYHVLGANWDKEFPTPELVVDVRTAKAGDRPVHDPTGELKTARGIEVGHIFQLGTKYSQAMGATFTNEQGKKNLW